MKRTVTMFFTALLMVLPFMAGAQDTDGLKVMSYNIRYSGANDGTNSWAYRYVATAEMLTDQQPDVMGLQEAMYDQIYFIEQNFREYKWVGVGRENGKKEGEHMAVFWNKKKVSMLDWGTFWLSETPEEPSKGWDAECMRTATWTLMKDKKTGNRFYFVNTHLDHIGREARRNGLQLIMDRIAALNKEGLPVVLTGDFNMKPHDVSMKPVDAVMQSARKAAAKTDGTGSYNNWGKSSEVIDYIYFTGFNACPVFHTVTEKYADRKFVSDHYPVTAVLTF